MNAAEPIRTLILHVDDVGMCHGANVAYLELSRLGSCGSGSVMVPCPWFHEVAEAVGSDPAFDLGVHLTLNSEMPHYKWRPLSAPPAAAGLTDDYGCFWPDVATLQRKAAPGAVETELRAQIDMAIAVGIDVTHLDAHMGAAMTAEFCDIYVRLGAEYRLPILLTSRIADYGPRHCFEDFAEDVHAQHVASARAAGLPIFETVPETPWVHLDDVETVYRQMIGGVPAGLNMFSLHCNAPGDIEAIEPDNFAIRTKEYSLFRKPSFRVWLEQQGLHLTGFRALRDALRGAGPKTGRGRDRKTAFGDTGKFRDPRRPDMGAVGGRPGGRIR